MPRVADPAIGEALVEAGAHLIARREPLTTRRLAAEVGVSTSAVYTHFGSMEELRRAIRRVGFERLAGYLTSYDETDDPVADLAKGAWSYCRNAIANPDMYRVMFMEPVPMNDRDAEIGLYTFQMLVNVVQRCIDAGRFHEGDAFQMAIPLWSAAHGAVSLYLAGLIDEAEVERITEVSGGGLLIAYGDEPKRADESLHKASEWIALQEAAGSKGAARRR